jgi:5-methyltetrahydropteroyltriglutamate--homocysteine methyltransferase
MKRSTERFLTTHTGSLPRPDDLIRMMYAKEEGVPVDPAAWPARARAVARWSKQVEAGIDLVNDGEMSARLRHLHQGSSRRLRRHRQHLRLPGSRPVPDRAARIRHPGRSRRKTPAAGRSACVTPRLHGQTRTT